MTTIDAACQRVAGVLATNYDPALDSSPPTFDAFREMIAGMDLWYVDWPGAADHFRRASELDSSYVMPVLLRTKCLFVLGQSATADSIMGSLSGYPSISPSVVILGCPDLMRQMSELVPPISMVITLG